MWRAQGFLLVLIMIFHASVLGQDTPTQPPPPAATLAPQATDAEPGDKPPSTEDLETESPLPQEHVIYLPFDDLRNVFEDDESSIVLPYAQFLQMWNRLVDSQRRPPEPPVNGVITRAAYVGSVHGELARLEATLDVEVLSAGGRWRGVVARGWRWPI